MNEVGQEKKQGAIWGITAGVQERDVSLSSNEFRAQEE